MDDKKRFYEQVKQEFAPLLRKEGFNGSGQNFRRINAEVLHTVNLQNNKYGGSCCVNLGLHFSFLPVCWNSAKMPDPKKIKEQDSEFRWRMAPPGKTDYWWKFKGNGLLGNSQKAVAHLCDTYAAVGRAYFDRFNSLESIQNELSIEKVTGTELIDVAGGAITPVRAALTMARIHRHLGNTELQHQYAEAGLQVINRASSLKHDLERLAN